MESAEIDIDYGCLVSYKWQKNKTRSERYESEGKVVDWMLTRLNPDLLCFGDVWHRRFSESKWQDA